MNIEIYYYAYIAGGDGYHGLRCLLFNPETRKSILANQLFKDCLVLSKAFAKKIYNNQEINSSGLMFEKEFFFIFY